MCGGCYNFVGYRINKIHMKSLLVLILTIVMLYYFFKLLWRALNFGMKIFLVIFGVYILIQIIR